MKLQQQTILVPTDFTPVAGYAIEHAVKFSKSLDKSVTLVHIIKKEIEQEEAELKMKLQADEILAKHDIKVETLIRHGSIFTTIGDVSNELDSFMVIMGTHGMRGLQFLTGSWALKVTVNSKSPILIVQDFPLHDTIKNIVFPVDFKRENKEKIGWACFIAKVFNAKISILKPNLKDRGFVRGILNNMMFTERYFIHKEVEYEITSAKPHENFGKQTVEFAQKTGADLIVIMTSKDVDYFFMGPSEQYIIANKAKIPVMCVNPHPNLVGSFSVTGI
ncbi:MAG: universal stress protein [Bacteroidota bacterium]|nr:universal stress protein [Bacteroidota bacterium]